MYSCLKCFGCMPHPKSTETGSMHDTNSLKSQYDLFSVVLVSDIEQFKYEQVSFSFPIEIQRYQFASQHLLFGFLSY